MRRRAVRRDYDVIVMGVGGIGSAALHHLARRGATTLGIERFGVAHDRGSSHGDTRIIRKAYFEHPDYVPLLHRAYELWGELEQDSGAELFHRCGFLTIGPPESAAITGLEVCYRQHRMPHERLDADGIAARYPQIRADAGSVAFFDPVGGYLRAEDCTVRHVQQARAAGAELLTDTPVISWEALADGIVVRTPADEITAARLIMTTGAWIRPLLEACGVATQVWRKVMFWYDVAGDSSFLPDELPTFFVEKGYGHFYGFPSVDGKGLKAAEHLAVTPVDDPETLERELLPADGPPVQRFVSETFPGVLSGHTAHAVCMYTVTPDHHFVIGPHPDHPQVIMAGGFSGHGFKFASVVGEILADLALDGSTRHPVDFLGLERFSG